MNRYNRRSFIRIGGQIAAGISLLPIIGCNDAAEGSKETADSTGAAQAPAKESLGAFGLQLYTLRDVIHDDPKGILKQVADMGYKQIEGYETDLGIFWGMSNTEFKQYLDSLGLTMISTHCNTDENFEKKAEEAAAIGMKYLIHPYEGTNLSIDDYKKLAEGFNKKAEICKKNGLRFAFHNHAMSFTKVDGQYPQDVMMSMTGDAMDYEMDIYWVVAAGEDPEAWLKKYPNRFRLCHVKDRSKTPGANDGENSVDLGTGSIDYGKILRTAKDNGMEYFIVEQEAYPNGSSLNAAKADAAYLKEFTF